jgi:YfiH family protein
MNADKDLLREGLPPGTRVVSTSLLREPGAASAPLPCGPGLRSGISLAAAGDMRLSLRDSLHNRVRVAESMGFTPERVFALRQVHSHMVVIVDAGDAPDPVEADGMVTTRPDVLLTVTVADCLPIVLSDPRTGAFGLVHSGWKGTGIVMEALGLMEKSFGTRPRDVGVTVGPGIGACCYAVPEERARGFAASYGYGSVTRMPDGQPALDLRAANVALLTRAGVQDITVVSDCTSCNASLGSFRRQGPDGYTLMLAWVCAAGGRG